ncbi:MAG: DUF11 domain-containing protein [Methanobrevibacter sp.]|nr:DUF11 domain-containing protein [Methanobrevibacter sp.]
MKLNNKIFIILILIILISSISIASAEEIDLNQTGESEVLASSMDYSGEPVGESNGANSEGAYLVIDNDADKENVYIGDYVTWIIEAQNFGPQTAKNTKIHDNLPDGLRYISHTATKGTFDPNTGIWNIGDLSIEDGIVTLFIVTKAITAGEKVNEAYIVSDTVNLNNETFEEEEIDVFEEDGDFEKHVSAGMYETGNPIFLILVALLVMFVPISKR